MDISQENAALCALNRIFGYHPRLALELMERCGSALGVFAAREPEIPGHPELAQKLTPDAMEWGFRELSKVGRMGFRFVGISDADYPPALREIGDPPLGLYLNGSTPPREIFGGRPMVGFVGTRDLSPYGKAWCRKLVEGLADAPTKPCIVSGLALGIDAEAHRSALAAGLPTLGVMATGIEAVYPRQHEALAMEMVRTPGCALVSDYPLGTSPMALNFMRRNRIIAALVQAVVVVESKTRGGSLMTARYAVEYGRDVYALPGRAEDPRSAGCNSLIREGMAEIITTPEDLAARLGLRPAVRGAGGSWRQGTGPDALQKRLEERFGAGSLAFRLGLAVRAARGISVEELAAGTGAPVSQVLSAMGLLEAEGILSTDLFRRCSLLPPWG